MVMEQLGMNPRIPDPREGQELSDAEFLDLLRSNDPFVRILNLGKSASAAHIDATIAAMQGNTAVAHLNLHVCDGISLDQLKRLASILPQDVDISWEPDSSDNVKAFMEFLTNQELSSTPEHKKVESLEIFLRIQDIELAYAVRDYLKANKALRAFRFDQNQPNVVSELLQGVLGSNVESLSMVGLRLDSVYTFAEIFWPYLHLRELVIELVDGAPSLFIVGQALDYAQYTLQTLDLALMSVDIDPEEFYEFTVNLPTSCPMLTTLKVYALDLDRLNPFSFSQMCQELPHLKNLALNVGGESHVLEALKPTFHKLDQLVLDFENNRAAGAIIASSLCDCYNLKILHLLHFRDNSIRTLLHTLPYTLCSLKELVLVSNEELSSGLEIALLSAVQNLDCLESVTFPSQRVQSVEANEINHICMVRSLGRDESLMNFPLGLYPHAIAELAHRQWASIVHHLVCEKHDELVGSRRFGLL